MTASRRRMYPNRIMTEATKPSVSAELAYGPRMRSQSIHGKPRPTKMLKTLLPMTLLTAMSPCPSRATEMEASASGTLVPAAMMTCPMTACGRFMTQPARRQSSSIANESPMIQMTDMKKVTTYHFRQRSLRQSGTVTRKRHAYGRLTNHTTLLRAVGRPSSSASPSPVPSATLLEPIDPSVPVSLAALSVSVLASESAFASMSADGTTRLVLFCPPRLRVSSHSTTLLFR
mmetsp:Transcript_2331/g.6872  ORF Transcript_2331/g.6872 Transcript_2331/m.6872 type:complete len:231 (+) Transcript_2331:486-1178(+)